MPLRQDYVPVEHQDLFGIRTDTPYNAAERRYSAAVQQALGELMEGRRSEILLLRRYHGGSERIAVPSAPVGVDRSQLRLPVVERLLISTISFIRDVSPGGPVFQKELDGLLLETQQFSTKHPHIVIERLDTFDGKTRLPIFTEWRLRRTQNQRAETQINRWLDTANLVLSLVKGIRSPGG